MVRSQKGDGGAGITTMITGSSLTLAVGGGAGSYGYSNGTAGSLNTGGGVGSGGDWASGTGGNGGSGIVILRYRA